MSEATPSANLEQLRLDDLAALLPKGRRTALEIGARHGFVTRRLVTHFETVTALDLTKPSFQLDRVLPVSGDVQRLEFPDHSFDTVVCTEVLEHVPDVAAAAREILRVARHEILIGVPYRQDTRVGRTTCHRCGRINPSYGHINRFDERSLERLFAGASLEQSRYVSQTRERTNALSVWLQDRSGNRYGSYDQEEPCVHCGARLTPPPSPSLMQRLLGSAGVRLYLLQTRLNRPRPTWIHCLFRKADSRGE
jgi:SAM-dependent methyltransferase